MNVRVGVYVIGSVFARVFNDGASRWGTVQLADRRNSAVHQRDA